MGFFHRPFIFSKALLCVSSPSATDSFRCLSWGESFYRGASEPASSDTTASGPVDFDRLHASAAETGEIEILGPPPFDRSRVEALVTAGG